jgi:hypothetical protein
MTRAPLTLKNVRARPVVVPLKRPVVSKVGLFRDWPMILIDLYTNEGVVGHSYLEPYLKQSMRYIIPAIEDLAEAAKGQPLAPFDVYRRGIGSLHLIGREGVSMIALSGLDMAVWDALAKSANLPLAVFLGGTTGPVPAYNSNGLWLTPVRELAAEAAALVAEGRFTGLKLRLGREKLSDDLAAIAAVPWCAATRSTTRASTGSKSRRPTTTSLDMRSSRASSPRRCSLARIFTVRACCTRRYLPALVTTSCRTSCASAASAVGFGRRRSRAQPASRCRRIFIPRWQRT